MKSFEKQRKSCQIKKKYANFNAAQKRCGYLHAIGIRVKPYGCPVCGGYHIAKRNKAAVLEEIFREIANET